MRTFHGAPNPDLDISQYQGKSRSCGNESARMSSSLEKLPLELVGVIVESLGLPSTGLFRLSSRTLAARCAASQEFKALFREKRLDDRGSFTVLCGSSAGRWTMCSCSGSEDQPQLPRLLAVRHRGLEGYTAGIETEQATPAHPGVRCDCQEQCDREASIAITGSDGSS
jgi:hypothetical protein